MLAWLLWLMLVVECALDCHITYRLIADKFSSSTRAERFFLYWVYTALKIVGVIYVGVGAWFAVFSGYWFITLVALALIGAGAVVYHWQLLQAQAAEALQWNLGRSLRTIYPSRKGK